MRYGQLPPIDDLRITNAVVALFGHDEEILHDSR
jgi:hypothetical protein